MRRRARFASLASLGALAMLACSSTDRTGRVDPGSPPSGADFRPVGLAMLEHCGSIDCHGSAYRNFRLYGFGSLRADPTTLPDTIETTDDELARDYDAVLGLEPAIMNQVVVEGGRSPERLTIVRKGRGAEDHKGGQRLIPGDAADRCITSWLASSVDTVACRTAVPRLATADGGL